jgi:hypothetical protein
MMSMLSEVSEAIRQQTATMTYLTEHLPFGSTSNRSLPPAGAHLLVSDTITAPGYFAIYHLISAAVLDKRKVRPSTQRRKVISLLTIRSYGSTSGEKDVQVWREH